MENNPLLAARKVLALGIGGIGVSSLAQWLAAEGKEVAGMDDIADAADLRERLPMVNVFAKESDPAQAAGFDAVVYSDALQPSHPWRIAAREAGVAEMSYFEALGVQSATLQTWAVAGTNGKSTTTAMLGLMAERAGLDPTVVVGTRVKEWGTNWRNGAGKLLVVEADEFNRHFLHLAPESLVVTNLEADHLDCYASLEDIVATFAQLVTKPSVRKIALNLGDANCAKHLLPLVGDRYAIGFGEFDACHDLIGKLPLLLLRKREARGTAQILRVAFFADAARVEEFEWEVGVPGAINAHNALAAAAVALANGMKPDRIGETLEEFTGTWRRFEFLLKTEPFDVISDYGHHPSGIRGTMAAAREAYPQAKIILAYEPHQKSRTRDFFDDFAAAFALADLTVVLPIYQPKGREEDIDVTSEGVVATTIHDHAGANAIAITDYVAAGTAIDEAIAAAGDRKTTVIFMGAGPIDGYAREWAASRK